MSYLSFEQVAATNAVKTVSDLTIPGKSTSVELQSSGQNVSYTMDGTEPTQTVGMFLLITEPPKTFLIEDIQNIKFTRAAGSDGSLNLHYFAGRDI